MTLLLLIIYQSLYTVLFLLALPVLALRALRHPVEMRERCVIHGTRAQKPSIWIHAASLGEVEAACNLLAQGALAGRNDVLLTVLSSSARRRAPERVPHGVRVRMAPLDLWFLLPRFLRLERPRLLLLVETELWPLTIAACRHAGIPVLVVSGRISDRNWKRAAPWRPLLSPLSGDVPVCAQSEQDAARFRALGHRRVTVAGNLKHRAEDVQDESVLAERSAGEPALVVLGSLRRGEEPLLAALRRTDAASSRRGVAWVIAPRHLRERRFWIEAARRAGWALLERSALDAPALRREALATPAERGAARAEWLERLRARDEDPRALLLDVHGELPAWFRLADLSFVGGTLAPIGGHSLFEPAREGVPVVFGPHHANVADLAAALLSQGGGRVARDAADAADALLSLAGDPAARLSAGRGALAAAREAATGLERTWRELRPMWGGER